MSQAQGYVFSTDYFHEHEPHWRRHLAPLIGRPDTMALEIGSFEGRSAIWMLENILTVPGCRITCLDIFHDWEPAFDHNIDISGQGHRVRKLKGRSENLLWTLQDERFDLIYVDGHHGAMNVLLDTMQAWTMLKSGGFLILDDYLWELSLPRIDRPKMAIDLFLQVLRGQYQLLHKEYQVILRKS